MVNERKVNPYVYRRRKKICLDRGLSRIFFQTLVITTMESLINWYGFEMNDVEKCHEKLLMKRGCEEISFIN